MSTYMVRLLAAALIFAAVAVAVTACGGDPGLPDTTAASVMDYLDEVDYEESWELWPGLGEKYPGNEPHGMLLTTYLNPAAYEALTGKEGSMPAGAIIVKENYTPDGDLAATTVMYKKSGYNPEHKDWFWLKSLADDTVDKEGKVEGCQTCHGDVSNNDYVWTGPLE